MSTTACPTCGTQVKTVSDPTEGTVLKALRPVMAPDRWGDMEPDRSTGYHKIGTIREGASATLFPVGPVEVVAVDHPEPYDSYGEFSQGYEYDCSFILKVGDKFFKVVGTQDSYGSTSYDRCEVTEVHAKEKKVVVWE